MSANQLSRSAVEKSERALVGAVSLIGSQIDVIHHRLLEYLYDENSDARQPLSFQLQQKPANWYIMVRRLMGNLRWTQAGHDAIQEIRLFYPTLNLSFNGDRYDSGPANREQQAFLLELLSSGHVISGHGEEIDLAEPYPSYQTDRISIALVVRLSAAALCQSAAEKVFAGRCVISIGDMHYCGDGDISAIFSAHGAESGRVFGNGKWYYVFSETDPVYGFTISNFIETGVLDGPSYNQRALQAVYCALSVIIIGIYALFIRHMVNRPMRGLMKAFDRMGAGALDQHIEPCGPWEFRRLIGGFNQMTDHLSSALQTIYDQRVYTQQIEFKQLQAQINPHFLYNTFYTISRMVEDEDNENARMACRYMGEYFQYITYSDSPMAALSREYNHAMNYLMLQKLRHESKLTIDAAPVPDEVADLLIPKLIFQPILENAFKHARRPADGTMTIRIRFRVGERLEVIFENSAAELPEEVLSMNLDAPLPERETTALVNIQRRIRLCYGPDCGLSLGQSPLGGLTVTIRLPGEKEKTV